MKFVILKLKNINMYLANGSGKLVFKKKEAIKFSNEKQAKAWFNVISKGNKQLGKFKDYDCIPYA